MAIVDFKVVERKRRTNSRLFGKMERHLASIHKDIQSVKEEQNCLEAESVRVISKQSFVHGIVRIHCSLIGEELYRNILDQRGDNDEMENFLKVDAECLWLLNCLNVPLGLRIEQMLDEALTPGLRVRAFLRLALYKGWVDQCKEDYLTYTFHNLLNDTDSERQPEIMYVLTDTGKTILKRYGISIYKHETVSEKST